MSCEFEPQGLDQNDRYSDPQQQRYVFNNQFLVFNSNI